MGVKQIERPFFMKRDYAIGQRRYFAIFAQRRGPARMAVGAVKGQAIGGLALRAAYLAMLILTHAGDSSDVPSGGLLRLHDGAGAESITAMQRQAMVKDV